MLLGGTGFVGKRLISVLLKDYNIHVIAHSADKLPKIDNLYCYKGSLGDKDLLQEVLPNCEYVFHLASATTPGASALLPVYEAKENLLPTLYFLESLQNYPQVKLIYVSTGGAIYGDVASSFAEESERLSPLSYYGAGKAAIEQFIIAFCRQTSQSVIILRPSNLYGPGQLF